ncbi:NADP-dependent oxidoreductase [Rhodanobacter sp. AS-Z3]|uniref:NADP-dependent oxidoreductase n=1 Tax=Rhodanobacter sp. AS-Z3 TaxID=3031330 RepID=UPI00247AEEE0|nr:NADP-dependent oxidoreductase [Rhodanobacter sp. AS-Z3]WEN14154.1 NADP-dependent oxidoreductase [Rhodanobacter sp. AS-Z3]
MVTPDTQQAVQLLRYPVGAPQLDDFGMVVRPVPQPAAGHVLLQTQLLSMDPYLRPLLAGRYVVPRPALATIVPGMGLARVVQSDHAAFSVGSWVVGETGWCEYAVANPADLRPVDPALAPPSTALGVLGIPGLTAWSGLNSIARPKRGETLLVSTATGAVGSVVGQLARLAGCRTVGIVGLEDKRQIALDDFGFDACVSYLSPNFVDELRTACPHGIDVYFDNVGGAVLEAAVSLLRRHARVVLCGLSSQYNQDQRPPGPNLGPVIGARARLEGLVVYDHLHRFAEFQAEVAPLIPSGAVRYREEVSQGLESAPQVFVDLMQGKNRGKAMVRVGEFS